MDESLMGVADTSRWSASAGQPGRVADVSWQVSATASLTAMPA